MKTISTSTKLGLGALFSTLGALILVLSILLEWISLPRPWGFLLGFFVGIITGLGVTLSIAGLIERRKKNESSL
jgi:hypothetical protein